MTAQPVDTSKDFTGEDRRDVEEILEALRYRVQDEFNDSEALRDMFKPFQEFLARALMIGDQAFANMMPSNEEDYDSRDRAELRLQHACKRLLASGRFDYYDEDEKTND
jgi:hypothetical protein